MKLVQPVQPDVGPLFNIKMTKVSSTAKLLQGLDTIVWEVKHGFALVPKASIPMTLELLHANRAIGALMQET